MVITSNNDNAAATIVSHSTPAEDVCVRLPSHPLHTSVMVGGGFWLCWTLCIMLPEYKIDDRFLTGYNPPTISKQ